MAKVQKIRILVNFFRNWSDESLVKLTYRVRHMSWYGISNGCGTKMAQAKVMEFSTAIYHSVWQLFRRFRDSIFLGCLVMLSKRA